MHETETFEFYLLCQLNKMKNSFNVKFFPFSLMNVEFYVFFTKLIMCCSSYNLVFIDAYGLNPLKRLYWFYLDILLSKEQTSSVHESTKFQRVRQCIESISV